MMIQVRSIYTRGLITNSPARYRSTLKYIPLAFPPSPWTCSVPSAMSYTSSAFNAVARSTHPLLTAFQSKKPALGAWLMLPGVLHARFVAQASEHLDWVMIDSEHGLTSLQSAAESILAIQTARNGNHGPSPLVRIPATGRDVEQGSGWQIKYALDAGARGVMIPMVSTASQARAVASLARFPRVSTNSSSNTTASLSGIRGFGSPVPQSIWNMSANSYFTTAGDDIVVIIQIETMEAVENLEEIASVDGVDVLFVGPYDLSLSYSKPTPSPDPHPDMEEIIQKIKRVGQKAGKKCAMFCTNGEQAARRREEGWDMINVMIDQNALHESISRNLSIAAGQ